MTLWQKLAHKLWGWEYVVVRRVDSLYTTGRTVITRKWVSPVGDVYCWFDGRLLLLNPDGTAICELNKKHLWWPYTKPKPPNVRVISITSDR
jgi:hypothetical protein